MRHKLISFCLVICILFVMPLTASAQGFDSGRLGSVSVTLETQGDKKPIAGAELSLYQVATAALNHRNKLVYTYTADFKDCGTALEDPALSEKLDAFVQAQPVPAAKRITDSTGKAVFADLPPGLYLVRQTNSVKGFAPCKTFLVTVPNGAAGDYVYDVDASPKTEVQQLIDITVKKVWNADKTAKIADSVTVRLLLNGAEVQTAVLSGENNWQVTYADMPASDGYSIEELQVPNGFTATYSQKGYEFTVTNTASLINTGQLVWPVPVLALAGMVLLAVGVVILQKARSGNE